MREVRVESLEKLEESGDGVRLSANAGSLSIVFPKEGWDLLPLDALAPDEPTPEEELLELALLREHLEGHARARSFETVLVDEPCGREGSALRFDLVLRPAGLLAATTGYHFAPVVGPDLMARVGMSLDEDASVEQAYVVGAVVEDGALAAGDESLRALSVRGRRCGASRFEMPPELWRVLSEGLGWRDVETIATGER